MPGPRDEKNLPPEGSTPALFDAVYDELRRIAAGQMRREKPDLTLQTTALVHEAFVRLMHDPAVTWQSPRHFYGAAAEAMRRILIERARRYAGPDRGGGGRFRRTDLDACDADAAAVVWPASADVDAGDAAAMLELDDALGDLRGHDPHLGEVVMLRYFAGLSVDDTARAMGTSSRTVKRDWAFARAWLARRLDGRA